MSIPARRLRRPIPGRVRWRYRRSLASRVTLLTTIAVGLAVAFVAAGAYVTVRMQLQSALDDSLVDRAEAGRASPRCSPRSPPTTDIPSWALGAADVRIAFVRYDGHVAVPRPGRRRSELERAASSRWPAATTTSSLRTVCADGTPYRVVAVPTSTDGLRAGHRPVPRAAGADCSASSGW